MMFKQLFLKFVFVGLILCGTTVGYAINAAPDYERLLKATDIEKATDLKGIKSIPRNSSKGITGMLNFADAKDAHVFSATFEILEPAAFKKAKAAPSWKQAFKGPIKGIGDEAYAGPPSGASFILGFKKGKHWITLSSGFDLATMKPKLTLEQIKAVAKIIITRL